MRDYENGISYSTIIQQFHPVPSRTTFKKKNDVSFQSKEKTIKKNMEMSKATYLLYLGFLWVSYNFYSWFSHFLLFPSSPGFLLLFEGFKAFTSKVPTVGGVILQVGRGNGPIKITIDLHWKFDPPKYIGNDSWPRVNKNVRIVSCDTPEAALGISILNLRSNHCWGLFACLFSSLGHAPGSKMHFVLGGGENLYLPSEIHPKKKSRLKLGNMEQSIFSI